MKCIHKTYLLKITGFFKWLTLAHLIISCIILLIFIPYSIINTFVSMKYEIDEGGKLVSANWLHNSYLGSIGLLIFFAIYIVMTIVIIAIYLSYAKKSKTE